MLDKKVRVRYLIPFFGELQTGPILKKFRGTLKVPAFRFRPKGTRVEHGFFCETARFIEFQVILTNYFNSGIGINANH
jgi:hypothetical protein